VPRRAHPGAQADGAGPARGDAADAHRAHRVGGLGARRRRRAARHQAVHQAGAGSGDAAPHHRARVRGGRAARLRRAPARRGRPLRMVSTKFLGAGPTTLFWVAQLLLDAARWTGRPPSPRLQAAILFDEADLYLPATSQPATKQPLENLLRRARSAGLGLLLAT